MAIRIPRLMDISNDGKVLLFSENADRAGDVDRVAYSFTQQRTMSSLETRSLYTISFKELSENIFGMQRSGDKGSVNIDIPEAT